MASVIKRLVCFATASPVEISCTSGPTRFCKISCTKFRLCKRGFESGFNADKRQVRVMGAQTLNGHGCGGIASHHHRLQGAFGQKLFSDVVASGNDKVVAALAIGRIATVGPVNEALLRHFGTQGFQNTQAANAAVKNADSPL